MENNPDILELKDTYLTAYLVDSRIMLQPVDRIGVLQPDAPGIEYKWDIDAKMLLTDPLGNSTTIFSGLPSNSKPIEYELKNRGLYSLKYTGSTYYTGSTTSRSHQYSFKYTIIVAENFEPLPVWNITTVLQRILRVYTMRMLNDTQGVQYKLDAAQAEEFKKIPAPEFAITNKTLKEALDIVGSYIHGVPRLVMGTSGKLDTIKYDMLGGTKQAKLSDPKYPYITRLLSHDIESYATELDSTVENLVNSIDPKEGSITDPYSGGWRSTRTDEMYARITDGNMIIQTVMPIQTIQKVECLIGETVADITPYVFEGAEYGRLSSFKGVYPLAKAFAIYYSKGEPNIKGLSFKSPTVYGGASSSNYAITNIIKAVADIDISASAWDSGQYAQIAFRVTYTPIFSSRIKVHKSLIEPNANESTLFYNQSDNIVETRFYGENMKGAIARMGNIEEVRTYLLKSLDYIPEAGELWGEDYYGSGVASALYGTYAECTVALTKNYNRKSQYIGINSEWRAYEVSENTAYRRNSVYSVYAVIGEIRNGPYTMTSSNTAQYIKQCFQKTDNSQAITAAVVYSIDKNLNNFATCTLPVISSAFGDVLSFQFSMADNYSAGAKSVYDSEGDVSGYWQTDATYTDYYGEIYAVAIHLCLGGNTGVSGQYNIPQGNWGSYAIFYADNSSPFLIEKNGGEILSFNYQLQFVTTIPELIIGSALARRCPLIGAVNSNATGLYIMPNKVGKFDNSINLGQATKLSWSPNGNGNGFGAVSFDSATATVGGAAWVIADEVTGEILLAMNKPISAGQTIEVPPICFRHYL